MTDKTHTASDSAKTSYFLERFPLERRSSIANRFFKAAREGGATTIDLVIQQVKADAISRMLFADRQSWNLEREFLTLLEGEEVRVYVREVLGREALPPGVKLQLKAERSEQFRREYMKAQEPTERQVRFLKTLGCQTVPLNRLQASELIEAHKG
ncbi:MAG: hypothetical protein ACR2HX_05770 [Pyrinomonadaceae bacterium]